MTSIDLTHPVAGGMPVYPGDPPVTFRGHAIYQIDGYRVTGLSFGSHTGTHIDAPSHTEKNGKTLDTFPISTFSFEAVCVDCRHRGARDRIRLADLPAETDVADADMLAFHTGWDAHWGTDAYLDHPYLDVTVAEWCATRNLHVGIDAFSPDPTPSQNEAAGEPTGSPAHHALLGHDCLIVENLCKLDRVPDRFHLDAFPLSLADADGAPVRAVARFD
ncbi:cyclase family protein [Haladaptatus sp. DJG-WS-42]|uniref:cyclase family protein n=1 Tax=Haladaptatus sp. DJG-WS-42 TaxID=3120516 RepID=UPI0030CE9F4B